MATAVLLITILCPKHNVHKIMDFPFIATPKNFNHNQLCNSHVHLILPPFCKNIRPHRPIFFTRKITLRVWLGTNVFSRLIVINLKTWHKNTRETSNVLINHFTNKKNQFFHTLMDDSSSCTCSEINFCSDSMICDFSMFSSSLKQIAINRFNIFNLHENEMIPIT